MNAKEIAIKIKIVREICDATKEVNGRMFPVAV
jgi:hypothetical protein